MAGSRCGTENVLYKASKEALVAPESKDTIKDNWVMSKELRIQLDSIIISSFSTYKD